MVDAPGEYKYDDSPIDSDEASSPELEASGSGSNTPSAINIKSRQSPSFDYHEFQKLKAVSRVVYTFSASVD